MILTASSPGSCLELDRPVVRMIPKLLTHCSAESYSHRSHCILMIYASLTSADRLTFPIMFAGTTSMCYCIA